MSSVLKDSVLYNVLLIILDRTFYFTSLYDRNLLLNPKILIKGLSRVDIRIKFKGCYYIYTNKSLVIYRLVLVVATRSFTKIIIIFPKSTTFCGTW